MTSLDDQLALSSPPVPARSPELDSEFVRIVAQAEVAARPRLNRRKRVAIGGLVAVGALGSGARPRGSSHGSRRRRHTVS